MAALVFAKIPNSNISAAVAGDEFALVGMNDYVIDLDAMRIISLNVAASGVPDLYGSCNVSDVDGRERFRMQYRPRSL